MNKYKVGGLFSGVGGLELGFSRSKFDISWANEIDPYACKTYRYNFKKHFLIEDNVWNIIDNNFCIDNTPMPEIDILTAGFPCQAFSIAGYRKGFEDPRGNLFFAILEFIKHFKPKAILLENVKNLKSHDDGNTFKVIASELKKLNYSFLYKVLNTSEYTTIPQNRERIFMVCFKGEGSHLGSIEFDTNNCSQNFLWPEKAYTTKTINNLLDFSINDNIFFYEKGSQYYKMLKKEVNSNEYIYQLRRVYIRKNTKKCCPTLTAGMGLGGHNVPIILTPNNKIRKLTPRECFNFQGFPKSFKLPNISNTQLYKQAGNSVSIPLISKLAKKIKTSLDIKYT